MLAAHRAGIKRIIVPERNRADLEEVPKEVVDELQFFFVGRMEQVLEAALERMPEPLTPAEEAKEKEKDGDKSSEKSVSN